MSTIRAVTFDLDGTLGRPSLWRLFPPALRHLRVAVAYRRAFARHRGVRSHDLVEAIACAVGAEAGVAPTEARRAIEDLVERRWPALYLGAAIPPGVRALADACDARGLPRAVVSDYPGLEKLDGLGLGGWAAVVDCRALGALKPLPDGLFAACAQLGVAPARLLHTGDRWDTDGLAAARAGCHFIHANDLDPRVLPL